MNSSRPIPQSMTYNLVTLVRRCIQAALSGFVVVVMVLAFPQQGNTSSAEDQQRFDDAKRRWNGALCRSRVELELKKKKAKNGWTKCKTIYWSEDRGNDRVQVLVTNAEAVRQRHRGGVLPIGTEFKVTTWGFDDDDDLVLRMELLDPPARVQVRFGADWIGWVPLSHIAEFEQWVRFDFLEMLSAPEEQLAAVETAPSTQAPQHYPTPSAPTAVQGPIAATILASTVQPNRVAPGQEVYLQVIYSLDGVAPGSTVDIRELRSVLHNGNVLMTLEATAERDSGTHQSSQSLRLPATLAEGVYEFRVTLVGAADQTSGTAIFEVRNGY